MFEGKTETMTILISMNQGFKRGCVLMHDYQIHLFNSYLEDQMLKHAITWVKAAEVAGMSNKEAIYKWIDTYQLDSGSSDWYHRIKKQYFRYRTAKKTGDNYGGVDRFWFAHEDDIEGVDAQGQIILRSGAYWNLGRAVKYTLDFQHPQNTRRGGNVYAPALSGVVKKYRPELEQVIAKMQGERFALIIKDKNGYLLQVGKPGELLTFSTDLATGAMPYENNEYKFGFRGQTTAKPVNFMKEIETDPSIPSEPVIGSPVLIYLNGSLAATPGVLGHTDVQKILNSILAVINQINAGDFTPTPESIWKADVTYPANTTPVLWQDKWLVSNTANNQGNVPISTAGVVHPTWRVISASVGSGVDEWEAKVYPNTLEIVFVDGALYYLDREEVGADPYVSVDFADELLEGVWVSLGGIVPHNSLQGLNQGDYQHLTAGELATLQGITRSLDAMGALIRYNFPSKVSGSDGVDANDFVTKSQMENAGYLTSLPAHGHTWSQISDIPTASATTSGILSNTKWQEFNNKIGGNIATGQVAFGTGAGQIGGDAGFLFNATTKVLSTSADAVFNGISFGRGGGNITNLRVGTGLINNTTGVDNTAIGLLTLRDNTIGVNNTALGRSALERNISGNNLTAIGRYAFLKLESGTTSDAFGSGAFGELISVSQSAAFGVNAGRFLANGNNHTSCSTSLFIGFDSRPLDDNQANQIVVGVSGRGLGSNTTVLGNSSTSFGRWWGNLLLGDSVNSGQMLQVTGNMKLTGTLTNGTHTYTLPSDNGQLALVSQLGVSSQWGTNGTSIFYNGGNVGVGTDSPSAKLAFGIGDIIDEIGRIGFDVLDNQRAYIRANRRVDVGQLTDLHLGTMGSDRLTIDNNGNVGIGTNTPQVRLDVQSAGTGTGNSLTALFRDSSSNGNALLISNENGKSRIYATYAGTPSNQGLGFWTTLSNGYQFERMGILAGGEVLIGQSVSTGERLQVTGNARIVGNVTATAFFATSDMRLKRLIDARYDADAIDAISYRWKSKKQDSKNHVGYSAQQVAQFMPDAVTEGGDGNLSVNYIEVLVAKVAMLESKLKRHGLG
ncbi:hypothetical protein GHT06_005784 [Daphnia sinensis]|uniref:Peptidase S74 domain-containing protein n=1 Tax=Daphnia sinensis TaxID=1820382 RepID=A0AAD5KU71_9CRUS|nr:hypothetical protein GHT06_005784 [Daphnia sinensis]